MYNEYEKKIANHKTVEIKLNQPLRGLPAGHILKVDVDHMGTPLDAYWRARLHEAKFDNCVEVIKKKNKKGKK